MRIFKKIYPYLVIPLVLGYVILIFNMKNLVKYGAYDSNLNSTLPFFLGDLGLVYTVTLPLINIIFGILIELLCRKAGALRIKIQRSYLIIGLFFTFFYYLLYTPVAVFFRLFRFLISDAPALYLIPTIAGFYLAKGLLASKESENS